MPYPVQNFSVGTVATAPSPATTGTAFVLGSGQGANFLDPATSGSYPVSVVPAGADLLDPAAAAVCEIGLCTAKPSADTLTVTRAQEGRSARTVVAGDRLLASWTAAMVTQRDALTNFTLWQEGLR